MISWVLIPICSLMFCICWLNCSKDSLSFCPVLSEDSVPDPFLFPFQFSSLSFVSSFGVDVEVIKSVMGVTSTRGVLCRRWLGIQNIMDKRKMNRRKHPIHTPSTASTSSRLRSMIKSTWCQVWDDWWIKESCSRGQSNQQLLIKKFVERFARDVRFYWMIWNNCFCLTFAAKNKVKELYYSWRQRKVFNFWDWII